MIERLKSGPRISGVVTYPASGRFVVISGQTPDNTSLDVTGQVADVLAKVDALLAEAKTDKSRITHAYIWLRDIADFDLMNSVWDKWVSPGNAPARATVEARMNAPDIRVEIQVFALADG
ncbi:RidA family protein [Brucella intermedia]|uniref:RidA family protein n=1 Tax=Brucella intermedia TaxID=94625 RepID=UPI00224A9EE3|nr:RidA family protein [Brucella intermedia]